MGRKLGCLGMLFLCVLAAWTTTVILRRFIHDEWWVGFISAMVFGTIANTYNAIANAPREVTPGVWASPDGLAALRGVTDDSGDGETPCPRPDPIPPRRRGSGGRNGR
jgi:hypothetical protein